jgi:hypothetical protein
VVLVVLGLLSICRALVALVVLRLLSVCGAPVVLVVLRLPSCSTCMEATEHKGGEQGHQLLVHS